MGMCRGAGQGDWERCSCARLSNRGREAVEMPKP